MLVTFAAVLLVLLALLHSLLGELTLLRPLFARSWQLDIPRWAAERIFRFAWHLTSLAWLGLAAAIIGVPLVHAVAATCLLSGLVIFAALRGHLAWPLFLAAALGLWAGADALPGAVLEGAALGGAALACAIAALHIYWAAGGRWGFAAALPQNSDGGPVFEPGPVACLAVGVACLVLAGLLMGPALGGGVAGTLAGLPAARWMRWGLWAALGVFTLRAVGDGRQVGFSKSDRSTAFAQADDALYSPLVVALGFSCGAALLLG